MKIVETEPKKRKLSAMAFVAFGITLTLCSILISIAIVNRTNIELLQMEQLVLEKSFRINEVFSGYFDELRIDEAVRVLEGVELETISARGYSYELFRIKKDSGEAQVITAGVLPAGPGARFMEQRIRIFDEDWYLRVFPIRLWHSYPVNLILIGAGLVLSFLVFFIVQNNEELKRMRSVFETMANIDVLTGIYNRRYIEENIKRVISFVSRSSGEISFLMIDVDFFKKFNDTYGHGRGDGCLKTVASALAQSLFREEDFVARYGGEEFLVVLPLCNEKGAHKVAERMLKNIRDCAIPHEKNEAAPCVTISIGGTTGSAEHTRNGSDYIKRADEALYMSKKGGRNQFTFMPFA